MVSAAGVCGAGGVLALTSANWAGGGPFCAGGSADSSGGTFSMAIGARGGPSDSVGAFFVSCALRSASCLARCSRCSRAALSRSIVSLAAASSCAFWPPFSATSEPMLVERVSSAAATAAS
jgi:hypothetical protein